MNMTRRLIDEGHVKGKNFVQIGLNAIKPGAKDMKWMRENEVRYHFMAEIDRDGWEKGMKRALAEALETQTRAADREPETLDGALCVDLSEHFLMGARGESALRYLEAAEKHLAEGYLHEQAVALAERALEATGLIAAGSVWYPGRPVLVDLVSPAAAILWERGRVEGGGPEAYPGYPLAVHLGALGRGERIAREPRLQRVRDRATALPRRRDRRHDRADLADHCRGRLRRRRPRPGPPRGAGRRSRG